MAPAPTAISKPFLTVLLSLAGAGAGAVLLSTAAATPGVEEKKPSDDERIRKLASLEFENGIGDGTGSDFKDNSFDFKGVRREGGRTYAVYKYRKTAEMMERMGPEKAKEFKTVTLDPNNPEDMKKKIYI